MVSTSSRLYEPSSSALFDMDSSTSAILSSTLCSAVRISMHLQFMLSSPVSKLKRSALLMPCRLVQLQRWNTVCFYFHEEYLVDFSELLIKEHEPIRRATTVLEGMITDAENDRRINRSDVNALLIFLHYFADACHQAKEEAILFPVLRQSQV